MSRSRRTPRLRRSTLPEQSRGRVRHQDLSTVSCSHHPSSAVEHRSEVVTVAQLSLAGGDTDPHRQLQLPLRIDCGGDCRRRRCERSHTPSPVCLNRKPSCASIAERNTLSCAASATRIASASDFPPTGRTLDIGEQKRHHARMARHDDSREFCSGLVDLVVGVCHHRGCRHRRALHAQAVRRSGRRGHRADGRSRRRVRQWSPWSTR